MSHISSILTFRCCTEAASPVRAAGPAKAARTTFQQVVGIISRLQRRSANEMVGPGVPRKLAFAQRVGVSRINRSRCFASRSCRSPARADFFFWTRFENLAANRRKINDRVVPILVAIRNLNDVIWLSRSEKVAEFAQCVAP